MNNSTCSILLTTLLSATIVSYDLTCFIEITELRSLMQQEQHI